ncbi:MAG TPA: ATP-binding protein [Solirubrobacteraceae bacterium]|jgi:anti-sigma regulatory factor (Ser/Thr protein kinase)|nr:ATP-binding protein [Solirubrobacteraceae bacterium]
MSSPSLVSVDTFDAPEPPAVRLTLPAKPENVGLARQVLAGLAEALDADEELVADMKIAVTEAVNNIVLHAYPEGIGPAEVTMTSSLDQLVINVRDEGAGMNPLPADADAPGRLGFGFAMMASLCDQFGINSGTTGTEVRMRFAVREKAAPDVDELFDTARHIDAGPAPRGDIVLVLTPGAPAAAVLGRFVSLLAAQASLSIDRMSDLQLVSDALAIHAPRRTVTGSFHVSAAGHESGFDLRVGPLEAGGSDAIVADATLAGVGSLLHLLSDGIASEPVKGGAPGAEFLRLRLTRASRRR